VSVSHVIYGLRVRTNLSLPGIPSSKNDESTSELRLHLKETPGFPWAYEVSPELFYSRRESDSAEPPILRVGMVDHGRFFVFVYHDGVRFAIEREGREVWADFPDGYSLEDVCTYLLGPVMGFVLRLRGITCLHASGIVIRDYAIALAGLAGSGKSTLAAAFGRRGFPILSDDVVALAEERGQFFVQPGYPRVNLWPDSVSVLFGNGAALPRITPTWDKRYLASNHTGCRFATEPVPLGAVYILSARETELAKPILEELMGNDAFMSLVANTYINQLLDREMRSRDFTVLGRLVGAMPIRRVRPTADPSAIATLCESIADDATRLADADESCTMTRCR
jgi:hypothetical protein